MPALARQPPIIMVGGQSTENEVMRVLAWSDHGTLRYVLLKPPCYGCHLMTTAASPKWVIVIDTNIYLSDLDAAKSLCEASAKVNAKVAVPCRVRSEVYGLSLSGGKSESLEAMQAAAEALEFLEIDAQKLPNLLFQHPDETLLPGLRGDDDILDYCRWLKEYRKTLVFLLSRDRQFNRIAPSMMVVTLRDVFVERGVEGVLHFIEKFDYEQWRRKNIFADKNEELLTPESSLLTHTSQSVEPSQAVSLRQDGKQPNPGASGKLAGLPGDERSSTRLNPDTITGTIETLAHLAPFKLQSGDNTTSKLDLPSASDMAGIEAVRRRLNTRRKQAERQRLYRPASTIDGLVTKKLGLIRALGRTRKVLNTHSYRYMPRRCILLETAARPLTSKLRLRPICYGVSKHQIRRTLRRPLELNLFCQ